MRWLILIFIITANFQLLGQQNTKDDLILIERNQHPESNHEKELSGIFKIYQKHISEQLISDCIYDESCSHFSQGAIKAYGPIKGLIMTIDRLTRCSRASRAETPNVRINSEGKIMDHWDAYKRTK